LSECAFQLGQAVGADILPLEIDHASGIVTENAGGLILPENNAFTVHVYFQCVLFRNIQRAAHLNGEYDATQLVDLSDDTCRFHGFMSSLYPLWVHYSTLFDECNCFLFNEIKVLHFFCCLYIYTEVSSEMNSVLLMLFCISTLFALLTGRSAESGNAVLEGAGAAVRFALELCGGLCFWSAVTELMQQSGLSAALSRLLRPLLRRLFPQGLPWKCLGDFSSQHKWGAVRLLKHSPVSISVRRTGIPSNI